MPMVFLALKTFDLVKKVASSFWGIIKCAQEKNITVLMNFLTVLMDL